MSIPTVNEWYVFDAGSLPINICERVVKWAEGRWQPSTVDINRELSEEERIEGKKFNYQSDTNIRISEIVWCNEQWIFDLIWPYMMEANKFAGWKYDITSAEEIQLTRYRPGGYYHFHVDGHGDHLAAFKNPENRFLDGNVRKLSMSVLLNNDFEGGDFEFASYSKEKCTITPVPASTGSIIVFPSSTEHRVTPVTSGIRYSLVCWFLGPPFR